MSVEISLGTLFKLAAAALGTYFLFPLVLVVRDMLLWLLIDKFVLTDNVYEKVSRYANDVEVWNRRFAKKWSMNFTPEAGLKRYIDGEEISEESWKQYERERERMEKRIEENRWYIQKRTNLINWLLKHYRQDQDNPIPRWIEKEADRAKKRHEEMEKRKSSQGGEIAQADLSEQTS